MPVFTPMPTLVVGDVFTTTRWGYLRDNLNKLLSTGHRVVTVAQFAALTGLEGTKGTVAPDEVYLEVDSTNGIQWHLAYESGEPTYKWRFIGGPPLYSEVAAQETTTSATYAALTTAGPNVALPRSGDYDVAYGAVLRQDGTGQPWMSYDIGGTGAVDSDAIKVFINATVPVYGSVARQRRKTGLTAVTLTAKYRSTTAGQQVEAEMRYMSVTPVRLV